MSPPYSTKKKNNNNNNNSNTAILQIKASKCTNNIVYLLICSSHIIHVAHLADWQYILTQCVCVYCKIAEKKVYN